jgi:hypothetical protein
MEEHPKEENRDLLKLQQDRLWNDHYWYTRQVIRDAVDKSKCLAVDLEALYENQINLGNNFAKLTGHKRAGKKLAKELTIHITIAVQIVTAAINGKPIDKLYIKWQKNATDIATVYNKYNECIRFKKINRLLQEHLETTLNEAVAIIGEDCEASYEAGEIAQEHALMMADYINSKF